MYTDVVKTISQAYCHLFFHCCVGDFSPARKETAFTAARFVEGGVNSEVDLNKELKRYEACRPFITDDARFLQYLAGIIKPANPLTLYFYCTEIILSGGATTGKEDQLLKNIAYVLDLPSAKQYQAREFIAEVKTMGTNWAY
jgi:hypothetical protein